MNPSPLSLVSSGRRLPSAGPGRQPRRAALSVRPAAGLIVLGLALTLMVSPAVVAVLATSFAGRLQEAAIHSIALPHLAAVLESGRALLAFALVARVIQATELE